jgi:hypothetical protein
MHHFDGELCLCFAERYTKPGGYALGAPIGSRHLAHLAASLSKIILVGTDCIHPEQTLVKANTLAQVAKCIVQVLLYRKA